MAETAIQLFADLTNRQLVKSIKGGPFTLANPFHQEKLYLQIQPLTVNPSGTDSAPYTVQNGGAYALSVVVVKSSDGSTLAGPVTSWVDEDGALVGSIDLYTAAMTTAMTGVSSVAAIIEFQFTDGSNGKWTIQKEITVKKQYQVSGTPTELPTDRYPTWDESIAIFVRWSGNEPGRKLTLRNPSDTGGVAIGADDNNAFVTDSET